MHNSVAMGSSMTLRQRLIGEEPLGSVHEEYAMNISGSCGSAS